MLYQSLASWFSWTVGPLSLALSHGGERGLKLGLLMTAWHLPGQQFFEDRADLHELFQRHRLANVTIRSQPGGVEPILR